MLRVAQKDFDDTAEAQLVYSQGELEITPQAFTCEILPAHVDELIKEAGDPDELNNLLFTISQPSPIRKIEVRIGFGRWATYRVESDDETWAYGRYHELTDKFMRDRSLYAKFHSGQPEILKEGTDDKWRTTVWEVSKDWRESLVAVVASLPWWPLIVAALFAITITGYSVSPGSTVSDKDNHKLALQDAHHLAAHSSILTILTLCYLFTLYAYRHWMQNWIKSKIVVHRSPLVSQFSFRGGKSGAVSLASLYVAVFAFITALITDIIR